MDDLFNQKIYDINWNNNKPNFERQYQNEKTNSNLNGENSIIIDNGSYEVKAGFSCYKNPSLIFKTIVGKPKIQTKNQPEEFLVGDEILNYEQGKINKKSPFDKNIISHYETQEHILDHIFSNLDPITNNHSKNSNNKYENSYTNSLQNGLLINSSYQTTHIVPILSNKIHIEKTRRISIGGFHHNELLGKSLHLKYPDFKAKITPNLIQDLQENYTNYAIDYQKQLKFLEKIFEFDLKIIQEEEKKRQFGGLEMYEKVYAEETKAQNNKKFSNLKIYKNSVDYKNQLFSEEEDNNKIKNNENSEIIHDLNFFEWPKIPLENIQSEEEIKKKQEQRNEQIERLRNSMQKKREENLKNLEKELKELEEISQLKNSDKFQFEESLIGKGYTNSEEMQKRINKISMKLNFDNKKFEEKFDEEKRWPFLNLPDEDLNEEQIRLKKIQKMQRNAYLSRLEKREAQKREKEKVEELKQKDPKEYLLNLYLKKKELLEKLKNYQQIKKDLSNRMLKVNMRKMIVLAELGGESLEKSSKKKESQVDDFGINDEDWEIYRGISKHNLSEDEDEDTNNLNELEAQIMEMDPNYFKYNENFVQNSMLNKYLFLGVDQFRGNELIFQPGIIGVDQAGVIEIILSVLKLMSIKEQKEVCGNIFLNGGNISSKYIKERILRELRMNLNCDIDINIVKALDPILDSWKGASMFSKVPENQQYFTTKAEYEEYGPEYMKEHFCSNYYNQIPKNINCPFNKNAENLDEGNFSPDKKAKLN